MTTLKEKRRRNKGRRSSGTFLKLPDKVTDHLAYISLSASTKGFLPEIVRQYKGKNNGDLSATLKLLKPRGWNSNKQITKCLSELIEHGLIVKTRQGGRHKCNLFAIAWEPIDECGGKLEIGPTTTAPNSFMTFKLDPVHPIEVKVHPIEVNQRNQKTQLNHIGVQSGQKHRFN